MKTGNMTHSEVKAALNGIIDSYRKASLQEMFAFMAFDQDVLVIGSGEDKHAIGIAKFVKPQKGFGAI
jgi:hypothetical protein